MFRAGLMCGFLFFDHIIRCQGSTAPLSPSRHLHTYTDYAYGSIDQQFSKCNQYIHYKTVSKNSDCILLMCSRYIRSIGITLLEN